MKNPINNTVFDSRDLIEYKEYLESEIVESWNEYREYANDMVDEDDRLEEAYDIDDVNIDDVDFRKYEINGISVSYDIEEYEKLMPFYKELEGYGDFDYGEAIIHEDEWEDYVIEMLEDTGYIPKDFPTWIEIDWDKTAENVRRDYMTATYEGTDYYMRA